MFLVFTRSRMKQKANKELEEKNAAIQQQSIMMQNQKIILDEKNKALTDSINYAQRIQNAFLASEKYISESLSRLKVKR